MNLIFYEMIQGVAYLTNLRIKSYHDLKHVQYDGQEGLFHEEHFQGKRMIVNVLTGAVEENKGKALVSPLEGSFEGRPQGIMVNCSDLETIW